MIKKEWQRPKLKLLGRLDDAPGKAELSRTFEHWEGVLRAANLTQDNEAVTRASKNLEKLSRFSARLTSQ